MADKRVPKRHKQRLSLRFGIEEATRVGFSEDISRNGMFIKTPNICPPNSRIRIEIALENENMVVIEARVMWAKKVPQNLFHLVRKCGMGVRFLRFHAGEEHFHRYLERLETVR